MHAIERGGSSGCLNFLKLLIKFSGRPVILPWRNKFTKGGVSHIIYHRALAALPTGLLIDFSTVHQILSPLLFYLSCRVGFLCRSVAHSLRNRSVVQIDPGAQLMFFHSKFVSI